jgi:hypothetical protein
VVFNLKNLIIKYSEQYKWVYCTTTNMTSVAIIDTPAGPGDWHITKTAAEAIKRIILKGCSAYLERNVATRKILISCSDKIYTAYRLVCMKCC